MKNNILRSFILISLLSLVFTGCNKWLENDFHPIPANYYPAYEEGDTFMYINIVSEDVDTFVIEAFKMDTFFNGTILYEHTEALFTEIKSDTLSNNIFVTVNEPSRAMFFWDSTYVVFSNATEVLDTTMQGFNYYNLYRATDSRDTAPAENLYSVYFDWKYGLVKYVNFNRDSYELYYRPE